MSKFLRRLCWKMLLNLHWSSSSPAAQQTSQKSDRYSGWCFPWGSRLCTRRFSSWDRTKLSSRICNLWSEQSCASKLNEKLLPAFRLPAKWNPLDTRRVLVLENYFNMRRIQREVEISGFSAFAVLIRVEQPWWNDFWCGNVVDISSITVEDQSECWSTFSFEYFDMEFPLGGKISLKSLEICRQIRKKDERDSE